MQRNTSLLGDHGFMFRLSVHNILMKNMKCCACLFLFLLLLSLLTCACRDCTHCYLAVDKAKVSPSDVKYFSLDARFPTLNIVIAQRILIVFVLYMVMFYMYNICVSHTSSGSDSLVPGLHCFVHAQGQNA